MIIERIAIIIRGHRPNDTNLELVKVLAFTQEQYLQRLRLALDVIYVSEAVRLGNHKHTESEDASALLQLCEPGVQQTDSSILQLEQPVSETGQENMQSLPREGCSNPNDSGDVPAVLEELPEAL